LIKAGKARNGESKYGFPELAAIEFDLARAVSETRALRTNLI